MLFPWDSDNLIPLSQWSHLGIYLQGKGDYHKSKAAPPVHVWQHSLAPWLVLQQNRQLDAFHSHGIQRSFVLWLNKRVIFDRLNSKAKNNNKKHSWNSQILNMVNYVQTCWSTFLKCQIEQQFTIYDIRSLNFVKQTPLGNDCLSVKQVTNQQQVCSWIFCLSL